MKKTFKTLTAFLLLLALIGSIRPVQPLTDENPGYGISVCSDDDETLLEAIACD